MNSDLKLPGCPQGICLVLNHKNSSDSATADVLITEYQLNVYSKNDLSSQTEKIEMNDMSALNKNGSHIGCHHTPY